MGAALEALLCFELGVVCDGLPRVSSPVGAGSAVRGWWRSFGRVGPRGAGDGEGVEWRDGVAGELSAGCFLGEVRQHPSACAGERSRGRAEQAKAPLLGFPAAGPWPGRASSLSRATAIGSKATMIDVEIPPDAPQVTVLGGPLPIRAYVGSQSG